MTTLKHLNQKYPDKTAFITGAASGLGAAFASLLAHNGWNLHLADIDLATLEVTSKKFEGASAIHTYQLDVGDKLSFERLLDEMKKTTDKVDLIINNAGIGDGEFFEKYQIDAWERMIRINLMGVYYGCHYMLPLLQRNQKGLIINIGSAAGFMNAPGMSAYNTAKAGVYSLSETLYHELKAKNIQVSVVTPTFFKTNIMSQAIGSTQFVNFAEKQMKHSSTNATEMARVVLEQSAKEKFQIIHPGEAKRNHFLKKWFPGLVGKEFQKMLNKFSR